MALNLHTAVLLIFLFKIHFCSAANVLGLFTSISQSHLIVDLSVIETLVERGHNVTVVTTIPLKQKHADFRHILIDDPNLLREILKSVSSNQSLLSKVMEFIELFITMSTRGNITLNNPQFKKILAEDKFDLIVLGYFFNDYLVGVGAHFKCPVAIVWVNQPLQFIKRLVGSPSDISYIPYIPTGKNNKMGFFQRLVNFFLHIAERVAICFYDHFLNKRIYDLHFPNTKYPTFYGALKNVSLVLVNQHFTDGIIRPNVPAMVEIGGIQIKSKPDFLPKDIQKALDSSPNGAILFSLGSNAHSSELPDEKLEIIIKVLSKLKHTVLWKWETDDIPGNFSNILFRKWLPQNDILAHSNLKLFITHGGLGSVIESKYHGVPMIGIPLFADQYLNTEAMVSSGYGIQQKLQSLSEENFKVAIHEVLENPKYRNNVKKFAEIYKDRPMSARETAAFWLEYVIRHKGAPHMQSPAVHMNFIEYYMLDVFLFLACILFIWWKIVSITFKWICSRIFKRKQIVKSFKNE